MAKRNTMPTWEKVAVAIGFVVIVSFVVIAGLFFFVTSNSVRSKAALPTDPVGQSTDDLNQEKTDAQTDSPQETQVTQQVNSLLSTVAGQNNAGSPSTPNQPGGGGGSSGGGPAPGGCNPGASRGCDKPECATSGKGPGEQTCNDNHSWGDCKCT